MVCLAATVCLALAVGITGPADTAFAQASGGGLKSGVESSTAGDTRPIDETAAGLDGVLTNEGVVSFGHVESLAGNVLRLSTADGPVLTIERQRLAVVKFIIGQKSRAPPSPMDTSAPGTDRILTYDGRVIAERVSGISEDSVTTERQTIARADVDRIFFALGQEPSRSPEVPPPPPLPPPEGDILGQICPPDKPLGGWVDWQVRWNGTDGSTAYSERTGCDVTDRQRVRFRLSPHPDMAKSVYTYLLWADSLNPATPESHYEVDAGKCEDYGGDDETCSGSAKSASGSSRKTHVTFSPFIPALTLSIGETWFKVPYVCNGLESYRHIPAFHDIYIDPWRPLDRLETALHAVPTPYGGCWINPTPDGSGMAKAECLEDPRRFAVIPFRGTSQSKTNRFGDWARATWAVCCGCGERFPPTAGTEPAEDENCFEHMASLLEFWKQEFAAREAALMNAQIELDWISVHYKSESRKQSEYMDAKNALADAYKSYRAEMANARRACMACAERQGLNPSQCLQYPPNDPRQD